MPRRAVWTICEIGVLILTFVQEWLGHTNIQKTFRYLWIISPLLPGSDDNASHEGLSALWAWVG